MAKEKLKTVVFMMMVGLMLCVSQTAWAGISSNTVDDGDIVVEPTGLAIVWASDNIDIYHSGELVDLMNCPLFPVNFGGAIIYNGYGFPPPSFKVLDLIPLCQANVSVLTFFFPDSSVARTLSPEAINALGARLRQGNAFIGTQGSLKDLIDALGLPESDDLGQSSDAAGSFVEFAYPKDDGVREDFFLVVDAAWPSNGLNIGQIWTQVSQWSADMLKDQDAATELVTTSGLEAPAAWNRTFFKDFTGKFEGGDAGTAHLRVTGWKLDTTSTTSDYYLIRSELQSSVKDFHYIWASVYAELAWYTSEQSISVTLGSGATLWDYMPSTAVKNITTGVDFSIGGDLGGKVDGTKYGADATLKANLSFKQSFTAPEITLLDNTDKANNKTGVRVEYPLADWRWYPFYVKNPPDVARTTYNLINMFIAEIPKNTALQLTVVPKVNLRKDFAVPFVRDLSLFTGSSLTHLDSSWTDTCKLSVGGQ